MKTFNACLFAALAGLLAGRAYAEPPGTETVSTVVRFGDLALDSPAGVAKLHARIRAAARKVCSEAEFRDLRGEWRRQACVSQSIARAVAQLNLPALTRHASS